MNYSTLKSIPKLSNCKDWSLVGKDRGIIIGKMGDARKKISICLR